MIHKIGRGNLNLTDKRLLQDLKAMKEMKHENLNNFVGICSEQSQIYTLMTFASRGSLRNILQEVEQLSMDFKLSLLHDIAQGLNYLHSSDISRFFFFSCFFFTL